MRTTLKSIIIPVSVSAFIFLISSFAFGALAELKSKASYAYPADDALKSARTEEYLLNRAHQVTPDRQEVKPFCTENTENKGLLRKDSVRKSTKLSAKGQEKNSSKPAQNKFISVKKIENIAVSHRNALKTRENKAKRLPTLQKKRVNHESPIKLHLKRFFPKSWLFFAPFFLDIWSKKWEEGLTKPLVYIGLGFLVLIIGPFLPFDLFKILALLTGLVLLGFGIYFLVLFLKDQ